MIDNLVFKAIHWPRKQVFKYLVKRTGADKILERRGIKDLDSYYYELIKLSEEKNRTESAVAH